MPDSDRWKRIRFNRDQNSERFRAAGVTAGIPEDAGGKLMRMAFVRRSRDLAASGSRLLKETLQSSCNQRDRERLLGTPDLFPRSNGGGSTIRHLSNGDRGSFLRIATGEERQFEPAGNSQLPINIAQVALDCFLADRHLQRDFPVAPAGFNSGNNFNFAGC